MRIDARFLPTSKKEVQLKGWDQLDIIIFSADAYVDHPSFGTAVIGRILEAEGYKVAIVPQPNWKDDLRDFKKLGEPRLFFAVTAGAMDSMVNKYTATKRLRSTDAYTPNGETDKRPDYPTIVYTSILKKLYPQTKVVIGGIEASLRRLTHYDYWQNNLRPSILIESGADYLIYGMGEKAIIELARAVEQGLDVPQAVKQIAYISDSKPKTDDNSDTITLNSYEECLSDKRKYGENFVLFEKEVTSVSQRRIVEKTKDKWVVINPSYGRFTTEEMDYYYSLPYTKLPHPRYNNKTISAYDMIKNSINIHRGCFGGCSFCAIAAHQGRFISSRSEKSILDEIHDLVQLPYFHGTISDVGGPSANMWMMKGKDLELCSKCKRQSCLFPQKCKNLNDDHTRLLQLYNKIESISKVKHFYIGSGIRYDLFDSKTPYLENVVTKHTSGRLKVAPEHTEDNVVMLMRKPGWDKFLKLLSDFKKICKDNHLPYQLVPYFISAHPGCSISEMKTLHQKVNNLGLYIEPVQDFTPTPMTLSTAIYYLGYNPYNGENIFVERNIKAKNHQKDLFFSKKNNKY